MNTYLVVIRSHGEFMKTARDAVCYLKAGIRGVLVLTRPPPFPIVRLIEGNHSKDEEVVRWCNSNIVQDFQTGPEFTKIEQMKAVNKWKQLERRIITLKEEVSQAVSDEEEARMTMARVCRGRPVVFKGKTYYPQHSTNKAGSEVVFYFPLSPRYDTKLDTV